MTKKDFINRFITNANMVGIELFSNFYPHLFVKIELESFDISKQDPESFMDDDTFHNYIDKCKSLLSSKYPKSIKISKSFFKGPKFIYFFVFVFNEVKLKKMGNDSPFFTECCDNLFQVLIENFTDTNTEFYNFDFCSSVLRKSANSLFEYISYSLCDSENNVLFSCVEQLSKLTYEKDKNNGFLLFYPKDEINNLTFQFRFIETKEFSRENLKLIRKLLELSNKKDKIGIISDTKYIYGIAAENDEIDHYSVAFNSNNSWDLSFFSYNILTYKNNNTISINSDTAVEDFKAAFKKVFGIHKSSRRISEGIKQLIEENKGTILVISNKAEQLINDYEDLCIKIEPKELSSENIKKLSSIDGAIIIDENGICYGFGAILDGIDTGNGDSARGSRYNSSERFFMYQQQKSEKENPTELLIFVLSDDGNYNIFPENVNYSILIKEYLSTHNGVSLPQMNKDLKFKSLLHARIIIAYLLNHSEIRKKMNIDGESIYYLN